MKAKGLTWRDGQGRVHVRQDLEEGRRWMPDLYVALVKRYGNNPRIANLIMGEYYEGTGGLPADYNRTAFRANGKKIWSDVITNAPRDVSGNRINIVHGNPILTGGTVTSTDIANLKLGISGSDPYLFVTGCGEPGSPLCEKGLDRVRQDLRGVVPLLHQGDANFVKSGVSATWSGIANPFGYTGGQAVPLQLAHLAWYFGSKGVVPLNTMTIKDHPLLTDDWLSTFDRFGPNGTAATRWGQLPNHPA
jgi:hypothetical protein